MTAGFVDYRTVVFRMNWAMGIVWLLVFLAVVAFFVWIVVRVLIWQAARRQAERQARKTKYRPDGQPYPPAGEGMCDRCGRPREKVYYMASGQRLCPDCYEALHPQADSPRPGGGPAADRTE